MMRASTGYFPHKTVSSVFCVVSIPLCVFLFYSVGKERMPQIDQNELIVHVEWNETYMWTRTGIV